MKISQSTISLVLRSSIAAGALVTLLLVFANDVFPQVAFTKLLFTTLSACLAILMMAIAVIYLKANINQFVLRHRGVDTAWLWFARNPPGIDHIEK
ncbi:hypothetical protein RF679_02380 [Undibacterium cyanobacteriorum]|uniref:GGDEF domain-containing protein n=1 Tax=Undibacterium cyanobacteriorum TaxID=3073561 RepID=A0ABY9RIU1_9BURK|nr:hypothetical protein [Undibacterium sp. 20NA77.5]WMW81142.1 hypothetical protein RF679_02380 [Undibacterium sp. 20NA77.5]